MQMNLISKSKVFHFSIHDNICIIDMNDESKAVNSFTISMLEDMDENLPKILANEKIEGIVINYNNKLIKLTGTFAGVNQLLGILRYNR